MRPFRKTFWTWLADITMAGFTIPTLLVGWALSAWLGLPIFVSVVFSAGFVTAAIVTYAVWASRRARPPANGESSVSGKVEGV